MKKVLFLAAVAFAANMAIAQDAPKAANKQLTPVNPSLQQAPGVARVGGQRDPKQIADMKVSRLDKQVTLTEEQKKKAYDIYFKTASMRPSAEPGSKEKIVEARQAEKESIENMLTADQKQKLSAIAEERKARQAEMMQKRAANAKPGMVTPAPVEQKVTK